MKLVVNDKGNVPFLMRAGDDMVRGEMPQDAAQAMWNDNKDTVQEVKERVPYCLAIADKWFFAVTYEDETPEPRKRKKAE